MSHYLDSLAAKSINGSTAVQPRLPSRFEPMPLARDLPGTLAADVPGHQEQLFPVERSVDIARPPQPPMAAIMPLRDPTTLPTQNVDMPPFAATAVYRPHPAPLSETGVDGTAPAGLARQSHSGEEAFAKIQADARHRTPAWPSEQTEQTVPRADSATTASTRTKHVNANDSGGPSAVTARHHPSVLDATIGSIVDARMASLQTQTSADAQHSGTHNGREERPASQHTVESDHDTMPAPPALPARPNIAPGPAPHTVSVTIGRIDVRAIMPNSPAARPAPARPRPTLSLDEYLKRRRGAP